MTDPFSEIMNDPDYIDIFVKISGATGNEKGVFYVESNDDKEFWSFFVERYLNSEFEILCYEQSSGKENSGKRKIESLYVNLNERQICGIDSDYDYLLRNENLNNNKYIIHTYAHSKESLLCCLDSLIGIKNKYHYKSIYNFDIGMFIKSLSDISFTYLPKFLYLKDKVSESKFYECFCISKENVNDMDVWDLIKSRLDSFFEKEVFDNNYTLFLTNISELGFNNDNAYQFIRGHNLNDIVVNVFSYIKKEQISSDIKYFKRCCQGQEIKDKVSEVHNFYAMKRCIPTLIEVNKDFTNNIFFKKIEESIVGLTG
ncbi:hypothetical protein C0W35_21905 [Photobacterium kishitanii]|uniref:DUF4435 domain-containing protein n=1 Tax=Photobacterium kishitanii TaxID=318456 RepID=UPI000D162842|nr:DUF4435 domain-containing protein [Photobacterium kishitanii]PSU86981.1 hypothetical protein C0W35_21905 [Photobacterium kishitanii]